jgi:hypothetical protein
VATRTDYIGSSKLYYIGSGEPLDVILYESKRVYVKVYEYYYFLFQPGQKKRPLEEAEVPCPKRAISTETITPPDTPTP